MNSRSFELTIKNQSVSAEIRSRRVSHEMQKSSIYRAVGRRIFGNPDRPSQNNSLRQDTEMINTTRTLTLVVAMALPTVGLAELETVNTRIGKLAFTHDFANGYPTDETVAKLFDEMDFQRACQAYIWALPLVSMSQWQWFHEEELGSENGQIILFESYTDRLGGLTYNATTPYALPFIDLADGPWIAVMPEGEVRGAAHDMWQIGITKVTEPGKYLFVGPGQKTPEGAEKAGYKVH